MSDTSFQKQDRYLQFMLCVSHVYDRFLKFSCIIKACKRSLRRLCFHRCLSVHNGVCIPACNGQRGVCVSQNAMGQGGVCQGGVCPGVFAQGGVCPRVKGRCLFSEGICPGRRGCLPRGSVSAQGECVYPGGVCLPRGVYHIPTPKTVTKAVSTAIHSCECIVLGLERFLGCR